MSKKKKEERKEKKVEEKKVKATKSHVKNHPLKAKLKALAKKLKHPFDVLLDVALSPAKMAAFAALLPLEGVMAHALKNRGVKVLGNKLDYPENLARQYYQVVILKGAPLTKAVGLSSKHLEHLGAKDSWSGESELEHADKRFSGQRGFNHDFSRYKNQDNNFDPSNPSNEEDLEHLYGIPYATKGITDLQRKHVHHKHGKKGSAHLEHWEAQNNSNLENLNLEHWETQYYLDLENLDILKTITGTKAAQKIIHSKHHKHHKKHLEHLYGITYNHSANKLKTSLNKIKKHLEHADAAAAITTTVEAAGAAVGLPPALTGEAIKIIQAIISSLKGLKSKAVALEAKAKGLAVNTEATVVNDIATAQTSLGIPLTSEEKSIVADADTAQDNLAESTGGLASNGDAYFTNDNGEVSHVLHTDGTVSETGAKPSSEVSGRKGLFAWLYNITHKKTTDTKTIAKK